MTIVLALGTARGWRSPLLGAGAALAVLAVAVVAVGPALTRLPIDALRLVVGTLVLLFGLQWLRKAILRAGGRVPLHDEDKVFASELEHARRRPIRGALDGYLFVLALKSTLLEGLEVVFIVLTLGASRGSVTLAALGAAHRSGGGDRRRGRGPSSPQPGARERAQVRGGGDVDRLRNRSGRRRAQASTGRPETWRSSVSFSSRWRGRWFSSALSALRPERWSYGRVGGGVRGARVRRRGRRSAALGVVAMLGAGGGCCARGT